MNNTDKIKVGIFFGGPSTEHEVSIITGVQAINNLDKDKFEPIPVYISKQGGWFTGSGLSKIDIYKDLSSIPKVAKSAFITPDPNIKGLLNNPLKNKSLFAKASVEKIDVALLCFHGNLGENGSVQGVLEMANIPYTGSGVLSSSLCMDKILTKQVCKSYNIPTVKGISFLKFDWEKGQNKIIASIEKELKYPLFVKPSNGGSSVGTTYAKDKKQLEEATEVAKFYDNRILVEEAVKDVKEINASVLGYKSPQVSECEQPISSSELLGYEDKYTSSSGKSAGMASAKRIIPAPIKAETKKKIEEYAIKAFKGLDCAGVVRIDFLLSKDESKLYLNEVNTIPGSLSFYLWESKGIKFKDLLTRLIDIAYEKHNDKKSLVHIFNSNILENFSGAKGSKS